MNIRFLAATPSLAAFTVLATFGCGAHTLYVGSTDGGSSGSGTGSSGGGTSSGSGTSSGTGTSSGSGASSSGSGTSSGGGPITYTGGCTQASCEYTSTSCQPPATAVDLQCAPATAGDGATAGSCVLNYECSTPGVGTSPDGGACPPWTTPETSIPCPPGGPCTSGTSAGFGLATGFVAVELNPPSGASAASAILSAHFGFNESTGTTQTFGDCIYDPDGTGGAAGGLVPGSPSPNPGPITATASTLTVTATPACDGTYAAVVTSQSLAAGDVVTFAWSPPAADPSTFPSGLPQVPAPHFVALGGGQAFVSASPTVSRASDASVTWTVTGTPLDLEQVIVFLSQGTATVTCAFTASGGSGVVPADALLKLNAGQASYSVFSQHADPLNDQTTGWDVDFEVNALAATPTGLAAGTAVLQ